MNGYVAICATASCRWVTTCSPVVRWRLNPATCRAVAELAAQYSNCPSGALGGSLGQLSPGQSVPEFDALLFRLEAGQLAGHLLETRFGYHVVQVLRRVDGKPIAYEAVQAQIADRLSRAAWQR